jgi:hypothetical protein
MIWCSTECTTIKSDFFGRWTTISNSREQKKFKENMFCLLRILIRGYKSVVVSKFIIVKNIFWKKRLFEIYQFRFTKYIIHIKFDTVFLLSFSLLHKFLLQKCYCRFHVCFMKNNLWILTISTEVSKMYSRCFGIMGGYGNFAFNLVVKLSVELGYVFLNLRL